MCYARCVCACVRVRVGEQLCTDNNGVGEKWKSYGGRPIQWARAREAFSWSVSPPACDPAPQNAEHEHDVRMKWVWLGSRG